MSGQPLKASGIQIVEVFSEADPSARVSYGVVTERDKAAETVRKALGDGWGTELTSRRLTNEQAKSLGIRQEEHGAIRLLPEGL